MDNVTYCVVSALRTAQNIMRSMHFLLSTSDIDTYYNGNIRLWTHILRPVHTVYPVRMIYKLNRNKALGRQTRSINATTPLSLTPPGVPTKRYMVEAP
jgi:hypothetical protein